MTPCSLARGYLIFGIIYYAYYQIRPPQHSSTPQDRAVYGVVSSTYTLQGNRCWICPIIRGIFDTHDVSEATSPSVHLMDSTDTILVLIFIRNVQFLGLIFVLWSRTLQYSVAEGYVQCSQTCCLHLQGKRLKEMQDWDSRSSRSISNINWTARGIYYRDTL